jgi:hypothetical protein
MKSMQIPSTKTNRHPANPGCRRITANGLLHDAACTTCPIQDTTKHMNTWKKPSIPAGSKTPRTDDFIRKIQTETTPFHRSFFLLLDFTRKLEQEVTHLRKIQTSVTINSDKTSNQPT